MKTLYDKLWESHVIASKGDMSLIYIDMHYIHEVTSPQAFEGLRLSGRKLRRPDKTFATMDHNTPTTQAERDNITDLMASQQLAALEKNCQEYGIRLLDMNHQENGIVHIIGPEQGLTLPGKTIVCGDSHTATHGAFAAMAHGIGTTEVQHVFATQTLWQKKLKNMGVKITGKLRKGVYSKDIILALLSKYGVSVGSGYAMEFYGETIDKMNMDQRMTLCNMSIEGGAKVGLIAPDNKTYDYLRGRKYAPKGKDFDKAIEGWNKLRTDSEEAFDKIISLDVSDLRPQVTWGTNPSMGVAINEKFPEIRNEADEKAYAYMGLEPGQMPEDIDISEVFIGSCTNGRYTDLLEAADQLKGKKVAKGIKAIVVPGSMTVSRMAKESGIMDMFIEAGFEWRLSGCSSCLGMNPDQVEEYKHCVSTSNRNFEGRQGQNARTHLVSPAMAVAAAINGRLVDISE